MQTSESTKNMLEENLKKLEFAANSAYACIPASEKDLKDLVWQNLFDKIENLVDAFDNVKAGKSNLPPLPEELISNK